MAFAMLLQPPRNQAIPGLSSLQSPRLALPVGSPFLALTMWIWVESLGVDFFTETVVFQPINSELTNPDAPCMVYLPTFG